MRKLIWCFTLIAVTSSLFAAPRRRTLRHPGAESVTTQYRVDAGRTGASAETGPRWLETEVWQRPLQGPVRGLVYDRAVVYAGGFGAVYAVNPATGADLWTFSQANVQFSPVAIVDDAIYVSGGNVFYALNRVTGTLLWSVNAGAPIDVTSPLIVDDVAYVGSTAGTVHAIDLESHAQLWSRNVGSPVRTHLASAKGLLIAVTDGALRALRIQDGAERWSKAGQWSAAVADDKHVYAGVVGGSFFGLDLNTGNTDWTFNDSNFPSVSWSTPALKDGIVVAANANQRLYTIDAATGARRLMTQELTNLPASDPIVGADGRIYFGVGTDPFAPFAPTTIYVVDIRYGMDAARFLYGQVVGAPAIGNGVSFFHDSTNTLFAFTN